jgi:hypothetical protein
MNDLRLTTRSEPSELEISEVNSQPLILDAKENLKKYALLVWRICKRRQSETIDRKSGAR